MNFKFSQNPTLQPTQSLLSPPAAKGFPRLIASISVGKKITLGYAVALGIAALGTIVGMTIAQWYQQQAHTMSKHEHEAGVFLTNLESEILQIRFHHHKLTLVLEEPQEYQKEYADLLAHQNKIKLMLRDWEEESNQDQADWKPIMRGYIPVLKEYLKQGENLFKNIDINTITDSQRDQIKTLYLELANSQNARQVDKITDKISDLSVQEFEDEMNSKKNLQQAEAVQRKILISSLILSFLAGGILAHYITRAITLPIKSVTEVAKKVTQEENFEEKAPITTSDEIGILADSLNQMIAKVKQLLEEQKAATTAQLLQNEKMASLGRMVAGIAHEINNPVNFIYANLSPAGDYIEDLLKLIEIYNQEIPSPPAAVRDYAEEIDIEFLKEDLPKLLKSMNVGAARVREIILSLKNFSRLDEAQPAEVDIHECLKSTLLILNNRLKQGIMVVCNYDENLPTIEGYSGFLSQVFINLISNAIEALTENPHLEHRQIIITTEKINTGWVQVQIADNGSGISPENLSQIFNEFFTTKPVGMGTGLGLTISYQIITQKHGGKISCHSELGKGTTFTINLPVKLLPIF